MKHYIKTICIVAALACSASLALTTTGCAGSRYHRSTGAYLDDKAITAKVKTDLLTDPGVKGTQVDVKTYQGKVLLSGFVDSQGQKQRASDVARRVKGVQWVKNDLIVKSTLPGGTAAGAATEPAPANQPPQNQPAPK